MSYSSAHWRRVGEETRPHGGRGAAVPRSAPSRRPIRREVDRWLARVPPVGKRELRRGFPKSLVREHQDLSAAMRDEQVTLLATSGTTSDRLQVIWEWSWWDPQEREAMRLNARIANAMRRADYREAVLTTPACGAGHVPLRQPDGGRAQHRRHLVLQRKRRSDALDGQRVRADAARMVRVRAARRRSRSGVSRDHRARRAEARHAPAVAGVHHADLRDDDAGDAARHRPRVRCAGVPALRRHRGRRAVHGVRARPAASERAAQPRRSRAAAGRRAAWRECS